MISKTDLDFFVFKFLQGHAKGRAIPMQKKIITTLDLGSERQIMGV